MNIMHDNRIRVIFLLLFCIFLYKSYFSLIDLRKLFFSKYYEDEQFIFFCSVSSVVIVQDIGRATDKNGQTETLIIKSQEDSAFLDSSTSQRKLYVKRQMFT